MSSNIFCLGFPFLQKGAKTRPKKNKHEKRYEIGKSVLLLHFLMVRISSSHVRKTEIVFFFLFQKPQC